jgi:hypothetical protein
MKFLPRWLSWQSSASSFTAVLSADVVGYSPLREPDHAGVPLTVPSPCHKDSLG